MSVERLFVNGGYWTGGLVLSVGTGPGISGGFPAPCLTKTAMATKLRNRIKMAKRYPSKIDMRTLFNGRHVYVQNGRHLDYYPTGCGLKLKVLGGIAYYADQLPPSELNRMVD